MFPVRIKRIMYCLWDKALQFVLRIFTLTDHSILNTVPG